MRLLHQINMIDFSFLNEWRSGNIYVNLYRWKKGCSSGLPRLLSGHVPPVSCCRPSVSCVRPTRRPCLQKKITFTWFASLIVPSSLHAVAGLLIVVLEFCVSLWVFFCRGLLAAPSLPLYYFRLFWFLLLGRGFASALRTSTTSVL